VRSSREGKGGIGRGGRPETGTEGAKEQKTQGEGQRKNWMEEGAFSEHLPAAATHRSKILYGQREGPVCMDDVWMDVGADMRML
jgi:hypothetical protein